MVLCYVRRKDILQFIVGWLSVSRDATQWSTKICCGVTAPTQATSRNRINGTLPAQQRRIWAIITGSIPWVVTDQIDIITSRLCSSVSHFQWSIRQALLGVMLSIWAAKERSPETEFTTCRGDHPPLGDDPRRLDFYYSVRKRRSVTLRRPEINKRHLAGYRHRDWLSDGCCNHVTNHELELFAWVWQRTVWAVLGLDVGGPVGPGQRMATDRPHTHSHRMPNKRTDCRRNRCTTSQISSDVVAQRGDNHRPADSGEVRDRATADHPHLPPSVAYSPYVPACFALPRNRASEHLLIAGALRCVRFVQFLADELVNCTHDFEQWP
jgi:hypothetical protein